MKTARRTLAFDSLEGKVLLSTGMADPAATVHRAEVKHFLLNGTLQGIPYGSIQQGGIEVSSFSLTGLAQSMGKVNGSLDLADPLIAPGRKPNLSNATLTLSNSRGSVQLKMAASPSNRYIFVLTSGSGTYASEFGSGAAVIAYRPKIHEYLIALRSSAFQPQARGGCRAGGRFTGRSAADGLALRSWASRSCCCMRSCISCDPRPCLRGRIEASGRARSDPGPRGNWPGNPRSRGCIGGRYDIGEQDRRLIDGRALTPGPPAVWAVPRRRGRSRSAFTSRRCCTLRSWARDAYRLAGWLGLA